MTVGNWPLMRYVRGSGCASKMGPGELSGVLCDIQAPKDENVLAGLDYFEDAGVYRLTNEIAMCKPVKLMWPTQTVAFPTLTRGPG